MRAAWGGREQPNSAAREAEGEDAQWQPETSSPGARVGSGALQFSKHLVSAYWVPGAACPKAAEAKDWAAAVACSARLLRLPGPQYLEACPKPRHRLKGRSSRRVP